MIISLSGKPGSGKSTVAKKLAQALGYKRHYIGGMFREEAKKRGMSLLEFLKWAETDNRGDEKFDEIVKRLGKEEDNFIIESRTAFHFIPHSLKIFLDVTEEEGALRIWKALEDKTQINRNEDKQLENYENVLISTQDRIRSEIYRYQKIYNLDIFDRKNYDLFLDTTNLNPDEEFKAVYSFIKGRLDNKNNHSASSHC